MKNVQLEAGSAALLDEIAPLWLKNAWYDGAVSTHFPNTEMAPDFARRRKDFEGKGESGQLRVEVARVDAACIGYCVSSVSNGGVGQVESFFVEEAHRGQGVGSELLCRAVAWMDECGAKTKRVYVTYGNDGALSLYRRFGFLPSALVLQQAPEEQERAAH